MKDGSSNLIQAASQFLENLEENIELLDQAIIGAETEGIGEQLFTEDHEKYHVWAMNDRRRAYLMLTSRWTERMGQQEAVWQSRAAAYKWAKLQHLPGFMILKCEGAELCGMRTSH